MNFGPVTPVTPEFKRMKGVHPSSISSLATFALLLDVAGSALIFFWGDHYSVTLLGIAAMPRGLYARLCHAFLVPFCFLARGFACLISKYQNR